MYCGMKELTKLTAWDKGLNVIQNSYIPIIKYKGIEFNEEDVSDIAQDDLMELFEIENKGVDELINDGVLTPAVKDMEWGKDTWDIVNDYLCNPNNHENILSQLDDMIYSLQNEELYEKIVQDAAKDFDDLEYDFRNSAESALGKFAAESEENLAMLLGQFSGDLDDNIKDIEERRESYAYNSSLENAVEDFLDDNCSADELLSICRDFGLKVDEHFIVYAQNGEYEECYDKAQVLEGYNKLQREYDGLAVVVYGVMGTEYKGVLKETPDAELTEKFSDKKLQKEKTDIEKD